MCAKILICTLVFIGVFATPSSCVPMQSLHLRLANALDNVIPRILNVSESYWLTIKSSFLNEDGQFGLRKSFSFPGTFWCGPGNTAPTPHALSIDDAETDACCRTHDHCRISISPNQSNCGVVNDGYYSISLCDCDKDLSDCLLSRPTHHWTPTVIGFLFQTVMWRSGCVHQEPGSRTCFRTTDFSRWYEFAHRLIRIENSDFLGLGKYNLTERLQDIALDTYDQLKNHSTSEYIFQLLDDYNVTDRLTNLHNSTAENFKSIAELLRNYYSSAADYASEFRGYTQSLTETIYNKFAEWRDTYLMSYLPVLMENGFNFSSVDFSRYFGG